MAATHFHRDESPTRRRAGHGGTPLDVAAAILALTLIPIEVALFQPLRLPMILALLAYAALRWPSISPQIRRGGWVFVVPALCAASAVWAPDKVAALRFAALMAATMGVAAIIASRLDLKKAVLALLISQGMLAVLSLAFMTTVWVGGIDGGFAVIGVFPHKNVLGLRMAFLGLISIGVLASRGFDGTTRLLALVCLPLSVFLALASTSATAKLLLAAGVPLALLATTVWIAARKVRGARPLILLGGVAVATVTAFIAINTVAPRPVEAVLSAIGKDRTLTGRTELWLVAQETAAEHPLLGIGAGNFWQADNGTAVRTAQRFHAASADTFSFHSLPFEIAVHLGLVGAALVLAVFLCAGIVAARYFWRRGDGAAMIGLLLLGVIASRAVVESEMFRVLTFTSLLFWCLFFFAIAGEVRDQGRWLTPSAARPPGPDPRSTPAAR